MSTPSSSADSEQLGAYLAAHDACCAECGYNLRGLGSACCPECGRPITMSELAARRVPPRAHRAVCHGIQFGAMIAGVVAAILGLKAVGAPAHGPSAWMWAPAPFVLMVLGLVSTAWAWRRWWGGRVAGWSATTQAWAATVVWLGVLVLLAVWISCG